MAHLVIRDLPVEESIMRQYKQLLDILSFVFSTVPSDGCAATLLLQT